MKKLFNFTGKEVRQWDFWKIFIKLKLKELCNYIIIPALTILIFFILPIKIMENKDNYIITNTNGYIEYNLIDKEGISIPIKTDVFYNYDGSLKTEKELKLDAIQSYVYANNIFIIESDFNKRKNEINNFLSINKLKIGNKRIEVQGEKGKKEKISLQTSYYLKRIAVLVLIYCVLCLILYILYCIFKSNYLKAKKIYFKK